MQGSSLDLLLMELDRSVMWTEVSRDRAWMRWPQELVQCTTRGFFKIGLCGIWGQWRFWQAKNIASIPMNNLKASYRPTSLHYFFQEGSVGKDLVIGFVESTILSAMLLILEKSLNKQSNRCVIRFNGGNMFWRRVGRVSNVTSC